MQSQLFHYSAFCSKILKWSLIVMEPLGGAKARNFAREVMELEPLRSLGLITPHANTNRGGDSGWQAVPDAYRSRSP